VNTDRTNDDGEDLAEADTQPALDCPCADDAYGCDGWCVGA
jgi:hypothetical protein